MSISNTRWGKPPTNPPEGTTIWQDLNVGHLYQRPHLNHLNQMSLASSFHLSINFIFYFYNVFFFVLMMRKGRNILGGGGRHHQGKRSSTVAMLLMLTIVLLVLLSLGIFSLPVGGGGASDDYSHITFKRKRLLVGDVDDLGKRGDQWTEILSWEPRAFLYHNFLSKGECDYLINIAKPHMAKSTVVDSKTGQSKDSRVRTSSGTFLRRGRDKVIRNIEKRIADFTFIPVEHGEGLQVLHYEEGQKYEPHFDYFLDEFNTKNGGQRIATVLMYLSDVEEGGETVFPAAQGNFSSKPGWDNLSECAKRGIHVKPKMGDALLFWSMRPDATLDPSSLHGGCPVIKGNKWSSTKWMHVEEYKV